MLDGILRRWPGYTLDMILAADAHTLLGVLALTDPTLGDADDGE